MSVEHERLKEILAEAASKETAEARAAHLDAACQDNTALRQQAERLLVAHEQAGDFLEQAVLPPAEAPIGLGPGSVVGRYKLLEEIGEGGFGVVFMAEQQVPVRRKVALKIVKAGMDTREVIGRFEAERQALALMDHPNIARVLDAGATESGRPYFVMELVNGIPITSYCDQYQLSTEQRLQLFMKVCQAVQHAHQKGIIHRDLKPTNILVTLIDGEPVPKIIDFGVAKALGQKLTEKTLFTSFQQMIGTPAYMSPEQAALSGVDVDTRSDIYSLGVLLYELLTGVTPFDQETLRNAALDEIRRVIRETEPPKPSTRLQSLGAKLTEVAQRRHTDAAALPRLVHGDLDWIVMKALEKDRARRYDTASALVDDLHRHLDHQPVQASPPRVIYRMRKFVRRHRMGVALVASVTTVLIAGLIVALLAFAQARRERDRARAAEQHAEANEQKALTEATRSAQVAQFLKDVLKSVDPIVALGRDTTMLREVLDKTAERVGRDLKDQPQVEAELRSIIGNTYSDLGEYRKAEAMHREALRLRKALFGETNLLVADSLNELASALQELRKLAEAEAMQREALAMRRTLLGNEHADVARSLASLGDLLAERNKSVEAELLQREALAMQRRLLPKSHPDLVSSLETLALILYHGGKLSEAEALEREALAMSKELWGNENPEAATLLRRLSFVFRDQGKLADAEVLNREALAMSRKLLGNEHRYFGITSWSLVKVLQAQGKFAEAEPLLRERLSVLEKNNPDDSETFDARILLGSNLMAQKKYQEAKSLLISGYEGMRQSSHELPEGFLAGALASLLQFYQETGWPDRGAQWLQGEVERYRRAVERGDASALDCLVPLARALEGRGKRTEALALLREAVQRGNVEALNELAWRLATCADPAVRDGASAVGFAEKAVAATERKEAYILDTLAAACAEAGQFTNAVKVQKEAVALLQDEEQKEDYASRLKLYEAAVAYRDDSLLAERAAALLGEGKFAEAEPVARECLALREKQNPDHWLTFNARSMLGGSLLGQKKYTEAEPLLLASYEGMEQRQAKIPLASKPRLKETLQRLVQLYEATGRADQAAEWRKRLREFESSETEKQPAQPPP